MDVLPHSTEPDHAEIQNDLAAGDRPRHPRAFEPLPMPSLAIRIDNLSKRYRIGAPQERYSTPRDTLTRVLAAAATLFVRTCQHFNVPTCQR